MCDEETDCQEASLCSGLSSLCPEPNPKENLTICSRGTRVCLNGVRHIRPPHQTVTHHFPTRQSLQITSLDHCRSVKHLIHVLKASSLTVKNLFLYFTENSLSNSLRLYNVYIQYIYRHICISVFTLMTLCTMCQCSLTSRMVQQIQLLYPIKVN